jgi:hypothetical protein
MIEPFAETSSKVSRSCGGRLPMKLAVIVSISSPSSPKNRAKL